MKNDTKEILAGVAFFLIGLLLFSYVFLMKQGYVGGDKSSDEYIIYAEFKDIEGIGLGSKVRVAGIDVGNVVDITLSNAFKSTVKMVINDDVKFPSDSAIIVESDGLFGNKYLEFLPGAEEDAIPNEGYVSYAQDAMRITNIIERAVDYAQAKINECNECKVKLDGEKQE